MRGNVGLKGGGEGTGNWEGYFKSYNCTLVGVKLSSGVMVTHIPSFFLKFSPFFVCPVLST